MRTEAGESRKGGVRAERDDYICVPGKVRHVHHHHAHLLGNHDDVVLFISSFPLSSFSVQSACGESIITLDHMCCVCKHSSPLTVTLDISAPTVMLNAGILSCISRSSATGHLETVAGDLKILLC